jgi:hypothetical protein
VKGEISAASREGKTAGNISQNKIRVQRQASVANRNLGVSLNARQQKVIVSSSLPLAERSKFLHGSGGNAGFIPKEIGDKMFGKNFANLDEFRSAFWQTVAESNYAKEFSKANILRMQKGNAPFVLESQALGLRRTYELHHIQPIQYNGSVYDLSNLLVSTPRFHIDILDKKFHFGKNNAK